MADSVMVEVSNESNESMDSLLRAKHFHRVRLAVMCLALQLVGSFISMSTVGAASNETKQTNPFRSKRTLVIPHGGGDGIFPENTLLAYDKTMAMGADVVDVDVSKSSDGVLIAFHDPTVVRITGKQGTVSRMTFAELAKLDAGWYFALKGAHPFRGKGITIPSLESILKRFPKTLLSLDLKDESTDMNAPLCKLLSRYGRSNDVQILRFRKECPGVQTSATMVDVYASQNARTANDIHFIPDVRVDQPPFRIGKQTLVDAESLAWAHAHGVAILTWVVNDPKDMKLLVDIGVDGIYTSYPDRLLKILGRSQT
jgi:glycerophosphoryl diester phosphodiesterase